MKFARLSPIYVILALIIWTPTVAAQTPHQSFFELPTTNGFGVGHFSVQERKLATFYPHIYKQYDADEPEVENWMFDAYWGVRGGEATWFNALEVESARYLPGTGIVEVVQKVDAGGATLTATQYVFFPFDADSPLEVMLVRLKNETQADAGGFAAFSLHNFHLGEGEERVENERYERVGEAGQTRGYVEHGRGGLRMYYRPITAADGADFGAGEQSPYNVMLRHEDFDDASSGLQPAGRDLANGFQFNVPDGLASGEEVWLGVVMAGSEFGDADALEQHVETWLDRRTPQALLAAEKAQWQDWQAGADAYVPAGLSDDEAAVWRQGLAVMRMAQVREPNSETDSEHKPHGQLLAALPKAHPQPGEGIWNIAWVRDGAYAIAGLSRAGFPDEARHGLEFMLEADAGEYEEYVGHPYAISITRYFGRGREESDADHNGPNIEFDGFGLFLWALDEQIAAAKLGDGLEDFDWWKPYWPTIRDEIADTLVALLDEETWLIAPDSSIWERHWNGNQKRFTYTSATAARGLCAAAELAEEMGEPERARTYRDTVSKLRRGIHDNLIDHRGALAGSFEELQSGTGYLDMAAVEVFNFGLLDPTGEIAKSSLDVWRDEFYLGDPEGYGGYYRNDDGDWYDRQEWVFVDLRTAALLGYAGRTDQRDQLIEWIVGQTRQNYDLMGELYCQGSDNCPERGDYRGSVPMVGFGPGAYILALTEREEGDQSPVSCAPMAEARTDGGDGGDVGGVDAGGQDGGEQPIDDAGEASGESGGCAVAPGSDGRQQGWFVVVVAGLVVLWRRRVWFL